jgi:CelD/BcsL family acetyltransferase involved in cellulose biosynthesis
MSAMIDILQAEHTEAPDVRCWRGEVPDWVGPALERLYGNLFSSLPQFRLGRGLDGAHTYAAYRRGELLTLFVFSLRDGVVELYNEVIPLGEDEIGGFARYVFAEFPAARVIRMRAVQVERAPRGFPRQLYDYLEDTIVTLPAGVAAYTDSLSKNTRRNVRRYSQAVAAEQPGFRFSVALGAAADPAQIDAVIALNHARMAAKNKRSIIDDAEAARLQSLVRGCGLVAVVTIDGRVCAGAISYRVGDNYFLIVLAHAPEYDRYSLGFLCCYWTICACIEHGGKEFHFLWGRYDYKRNFLGRLRRLDQLLLYRSHLAMCMHARLALRTWHRAMQRRAMLWLQQAKHQDTVTARAALTLYNLARRWRQRLAGRQPR